MGKGDKKTKRGKIVIGSYGVRRPRKKGPAFQPEEGKKTKKDKTATTEEKKEVKATPKKEAAKKAPAKKAPAKKTTTKKTETKAQEKEEETAVKSEKEDEKKTSEDEKA